MEENYEVARSGKSKKGWIIGIVIAVLVLAAMGDDKDESGSADSSNTEAVTEAEDKAVKKLKSLIYDKYSNSNCETEVETIYTGEDASGYNRYVVVVRYKLGKGYFEGTEGSCVFQVGDAIVISWTDFYDYDRDYEKDLEDLKVMWEL